MCTWRGGLGPYHWGMTLAEELSLQPQVRSPDTHSLLCPFYLGSVQNKVMSSSERARGAKQLVDSEIPRTKRGKEETPTSNRRLGELFSTLLQNSPGPSDS